MQTKTALLFLFLMLFVAGCAKEQIAYEFQLHTLPEASLLRKIAFTDTQSGIIAGGNRWESADIWQTSDGGANWQKSTLATGQGIHGMDFSPSSQTHYFGTTDGKILKQTASDLYVFQTNIDSLGWRPILAIQSIGNDTILACGGDSYIWGVLHKSFDGGISWNYELFDFQLFDLQLIGSKKGYACGMGAVLKTEDSGNSWQRLSPQNDIFKALFFLDENNGYLVGDEGSILHTQNGGETWQTQEKENALIGRKNHWNDIHFYDQTHGFVAGDKGKAAFTLDGKNWQIIDDLPDCDFKSVWAIAPETALLIGNDGCILTLKINEE